MSSPAVTGHKLREQGMGACDVRRGLELLLGECGEWAQMVLDSLLDSLLLRRFAGWAPHECCCSTMSRVSFPRIAHPGSETFK